MVALSGCLTEEPGEEGDEPTPEPQGITDPSQVAAGNHMLYLHNDGELWMDTDEDPTDSEVTGMYTLGGEETFHVFPLRPMTQEDLVLGGAATVTAIVSMEGLVGMSPQVRARVLVDGETFSESAFSGMSGRFTIGVPRNISAGTELALALCVCPQQASVAYGYALRTDGSSHLELPVVSPVFADAGSTPPPMPQGKPTEERSDVETGQRQDGTWYARRTVTITNGFGASEAEVELLTGNGGVDAATWGEDGYRVVARLEGRGDTEQDAEARLEELRVVHRDDGASVSTVIEAEADEWRDKAASIEARLPGTPHYTGLEAGTTNGNVDAVGFRGGDMKLLTTNGALSCEGLVAASLTLTTTNGGIDCAATVDSLEASTTNGQVVLDMRAAASGAWAVSSGNGQIELTVPEGADRGYDVTGTTSNGLVEFDFQETEPVGEQTRTSKHERTTGFGEREVQTTVGLSTTNGSIDAGS